MPYDITIKEFDEMVAADIPKFATGLNYFVDDSVDEVRVENLDVEMLPYLSQENFKMRYNQQKISYNINLGMHAPNILDPEDDSHLRKLNLN